MIERSPEVYGLTGMKELYEYRKEKWAFALTVG